ncbi:MAG: nodulation protein NfeD [Thermoplasmataceae archaeon]
MISRTVILILIFFTLSIMVQTASGGQPSKDVIVLNLHEEIDPGSSAFFSSYLSAVSRSTTAAVVIDMNTPGGILNNMLEMIQYINATEEMGVPVYTYIIPDGNGASAGSYVAMACTGIYMGPGSYIGPSTPIVVGGTSLEQNHTENAMLALMESMAYSHGRNVTAAYAMVENNTAYTASQALQIGLVNGIYSNLSSMLDGLNLSQYPVVQEYPGFYDNFLSFISNTTVDGLLILIGSIAILADLYHGTAVLSIVGIVMMALGLLGAEVIGASYVGIFLLLTGAVLIIAEVKLGHGYALISGVVAAIIGMFLLASPYLSSNPNPGYSPSPFGVYDYLASVMIGLGAVVFGLFIRRIAISFRSRPAVGPESIIGKEGVAKSDIAQSGWVSLEGIQWRARSQSGELIPRGSEIVVTSRENLVLVVKKK